MPGRPKSGSAASRRGHASTAPQAAPLALPKNIQAAAEDGKAGVVQTWLARDGRVDATCVRNEVSGWTLLRLTYTIIDASSASCGLGKEEGLECESPCASPHT